MIIGQSQSGNPVIAIAGRSESDDQSAICDFLADPNTALQFFPIVSRSESKDAFLTIVARSESNDSVHTIVVADRNAAIYFSRSFTDPNTMMRLLRSMVDPNQLFN